jgi:hypothetical protein
LPLLLAFLAPLSCGPKNEPPAPGGSRPPIKPPEEPPPLAVSAEQLAKDYHADQAAADKKYKDKTLEVEGVVTSLVNYDLGGAMVLLKGIHDGVDEKLVVVPTACFFGKANSGKASTVSKGQKITVRGLCQGKHAEGPGVWNCEVLRTGEDPAIHVQAKQLSREYIEDEKKANAQYAEKFLVVEGVIREAQIREFDGSITFEGADEKAAPAMRVTVRVGGSFADRPLLNSLKKGQTRTIRGKCSGSVNGEVVFHNPFIAP